MNSLFEQDYCDTYDTIRDISDETTLRELVKELEHEIKNKVGPDLYKFSEQEPRGEDYDTVKNMLHIRQDLLDRMFQATAEEITRFEQVNRLLDTLTKKMYQRTASLYRSFLLFPPDKEFDDAYEIRGHLTLSIDYDPEEGNCYNTLLTLSNDAYYGSDFGYMTALIHETEYMKDIVWSSIEYNKTHRPDLSDKELECYDHWDDRLSWAEAQLRRKELEHICICYAIHDICTHHPFSIPDLLRLNDFQVDVRITCQHLVDQEGNRTNLLD